MKKDDESTTKQGNKDNTMLCSVNAPKNLKLNWCHISQKPKINDGRQVMLWYPEPHCLIRTGFCYLYRDGSFKFSSDKSESKMCCNFTHYALIEYD